MATSLHIALLTKEQFANQYEREKLEAGESTDFSNVVHEGYETFWIGPRLWFHEEFMAKPFTWGMSRIITKEELLKMLAPAREYVNDPEEGFEADVIASVLSDYKDLEDKLNALNEETHILIGHAV